jgi:peptidoglycan hydrolase-like protein with peptidoglycan-binding domain
VRRLRALLVAALAAACAGIRSPRDEKPAAEASAESGPARVPRTPEALLGEPTVRRVQEALSRRGYLGRHRGGDLDAPTTAAVQRFQSDEGLARTGFPDRETLSRLGIDPDEAHGSGSGGRK